MYFLIGVIVLIVFILIVYIYLRLKIRSILNKTGFSGMNLKDIIEQARLEDQETAKSLASMDRIYLNQIKKDFIDIDINELERISEKVIRDCYQAVEDKDSSKLRGKIKSFVDGIIDDYKDKDIKISNFKFHNTVISDYKKDKGTARIYFSSAYEYYLDVDGKSVKTQDRAKSEFIYVIDESKLDNNINALGIHCPNCGSPITSLGEKNCSYCGSVVREVVGRVFSCNDIVRY